MIQRQLLTSDPINSEPEICIRKMNQDICTNLTFSKNSPVSSSSPGSTARMKAFMAGLRPDCNGR